jgi:3',5'-cyclic AMP phosphodiesterase CpdA
MIVVQMHQCAMSSSTAGNGSDLGIRQAWLPLFDTYSVDLVLSGHEHNYERTFAVRGYNPDPVGMVVSANPGQAANGSSVFTRQPLVASGAETTYQGLTAFDTSQGAGRGLARGRRHGWADEHLRQLRRAASGQGDHHPKPHIRELVRELREKWR